MNQVFRQFSMGAVAIAIMQAASAQVSMTNIVPTQIAGQGTEIRVMFNGLPPQPQAYQLENPSRLILDFDKAQQSLKKSKIAVATNEASSVDVTSDDVRSRLTVNLKDAGAFTTRVEGNTFILKINSAQTTNKPIPAATAQPQGVSNIGFQRGSQGEGLVVVDLLGSNTPVDVQQQGSKVVIRTLGTKIPTHLARRLNVNDFATPVSSIDAYNEKGAGVITIQSSGSYEYMAYQAENKLTISLKRPQDKSTSASYKAPSYSGNKLSLDFQDIEVRRVLQLLADFTGINMVAADSVQGNITLRLKDVPWDQALDIILKTKNLDKRRNGNVIWIAPVTELIKAEDDEAKALAQTIKLAPIQTDYIRLSYAKAIDVLKLIEDTRDGKGAVANRTANSDSLALESLLSSRGSAVADTRTNTLIVNDTAQNIDKVRKMIELLDVQVKQVMVEARIVRASTSFTKELGVKWGILSQGITNNKNLLVGGSETTLWNLRDPKKDETTGGYKYTIERPDNLNVDLGVSNPAGSIAFGLISMSDFMLDLELSALQADGYGEVISTPKVMTADKQTAKVATGQQVPYLTTTISGAGSAATTSFKDALLSLDVTPSITPDGKIQMKLDISKDSVAGEAPNGELILNKNNINTNVLVDNGETVILGGVFEQTTTNTQTKVPFFGDIPLVGRLFRKDVKSDDKQELLIFVTPRIVNDTLARNH
ncbi:type IV pilus secretin PilQ family protein [Acinetobacter seifertii]|uniref:Type IV pilus secretin PilQ family protein n=1 Tax=Acinetobacter seifertii TaxID=1530123 RepID=A0A7H2T0Q5_9GAMM|nr:type IV pilus secretin PilQ family protein [Acinetobacter seifertii]QNX12561.1 type IV pilus secretin PilQ family protein [Acinetobacter seifertii]QNX19512.1 type IV pilus secretin PilQ family protein [Acinetobacter seifertii]QNX26119.1 type IV pilus secretin PilQ family protein [Acinetobacter seifertii]QNX37149.1 type IV pilus secretin PilQ family protein [Acinetobacter seifertii]QNX40905.1 type IV pilus secretin PilQ family protein [Acinetobacter seifertii]